MVWGFSRGQPAKQNRGRKLRKYLLAAAAAAAIAAPAAARDHSGYVGVDAGALWGKSSLNLDASDSYYCDEYFSYYSSTCAVRLGSKHKVGYDVDVVGGYDFGMFRLEGELAYKHAK